MSAKVDPAAVAQLRGARHLALVLAKGALVQGSAIGLCWLFAHLDPKGAALLDMALQLDPLPEEIAEPEGLEGAEVGV